MIDSLVSFLSFVVGIVLGVVFFGGLWWTVGRGLTSPRPALWFVCSMVLRTGIVLVGFYWVLGTHWQRLVLCLIGFIVGRVLVTRFTRPALPVGPQLHEEPVNVA